MIVILATQEAWGSNQPQQIISKTYIKNTHHKKRLAEWLPVYAPTSYPTMAKKEKWKRNVRKINKESNMDDRKIQANLEL
jgi:hypothetical protein